MGSKTIMVTGGAGFIGSHLCEQILSRGYKVVCVDNLLTGKHENIRQLEGPDLTFIHHDVTRHIDYPGDLHAILHFASPASPIDYLQLPIQTLKVGSLGTHNTLGLAKAKNAAYLLASTSEVYGDPLVHPQQEEYWGNVNPVGPRGVYDEAKRFAEAMVMAYHRVHKVNTKIVRIFNTYGPRMRHNDGRVVPAFICQALKNESITIFGRGTQTRSFCYVSDLVRGILQLLESDYHEPVNVGNPREMTVLEFANVVKTVTACTSSFIFKELPIDDPKKRQPDITLARQILGWQPEVLLEEGLTKTAAYFRDLLERGEIE